MSYRKWELLSEVRPSAPGEYWVGVMEYPFELTPSRIRLHGVQQVARMGGAFLLENEFPADQIIWHGPIDPPIVPRDAERRLRKEQGSAFSRQHEKICSNCGDTSKVNARSIGFTHAPADCRACGKLNSAIVLRKSSEDHFASMIS